MPTAQQKKGHKIKLLVSHCPDKRGSTVYVIIKSLQTCNKLTATFK